MWIRENISVGEAPPFYGILNSGDEEDNMVLFPWVRSHDRGLYVGSFFTKIEPEAPLIGMTEMDDLCRGVNEFCEGIADLDFGAKLLARCHRGLKIPWAEVVSIGRAVEFLPNRGRDQD